MKRKILLSQEQSDVEEAMKKVPPFLSLIVRCCLMNLVNGVFEAFKDLQGIKVQEEAIRPIMPVPHQYQI